MQSYQCEYSFLTKYKRLYFWLFEFAPLQFLEHPLYIAYDRNNKCDLWCSKESLLASKNPHLFEFYHAKLILTAWFLFFNYRCWCRDNVRNWCAFDSTTDMVMSNFTHFHRLLLRLLWMQLDLVTSFHQSHSLVWRYILHLVWGLLLWNWLHRYWQNRYVHHPSQSI